MAVNENRVTYPVSGKRNHTAKKQTKHLFFVFSCFRGLVSSSLTLREFLDFAHLGSYSRASTIHHIRFDRQAHSVSGVAGSPAPPGESK